MDADTTRLTADDITAVHGNHSASVLSMDAVTAVVADGGIAHIGAGAATHLDSVQRAPYNRTMVNDTTTAAAKHVHP